MPNQLIPPDERSSFNDIHSKIISIRNTQVILDRDLSKLYQTETRTLKQAVKRNKKRFPPDFIFELSHSEIESLVSQSVIPSKKYLGGAQPLAFTEQGVAMLSSVIKTNTAIDINLKIIRAFVQMRRFLSQNAEIFTRLQRLEEYKKISSEQLDKLFQALDDKTLQPKQGIFYDGQIFDAYRFARKIVKSAKSSLILIDNYVNEDTLHILSSCKSTITCDIYTSKITKKLELDLAKYNEQNSPITIHQFDRSHDRFLIVDKKILYHFGASLKDLGKKWFACTRFDSQAITILQKLQGEPGK